MGGGLSFKKNCYLEKKVGHRQTRLLDKIFFERTDCLDKFSWYIRKIMEKSILFI